MKVHYLNKINKNVRYTLQLLYHKWRNIIWLPKFYNNLIKKYPLKIIKKKVNQNLYNKQTAVLDSLKNLYKKCSIYFRNINHQYKELDK